MLLLKQKTNLEIIQCRRFRSCRHWAGVLKIKVLFLLLKSREFLKVLNYLTFHALNKKCTSMKIRAISKTAAIRSPEQNILLRKRRIVYFSFYTLKVVKSSSIYITYIRPILRNFFISFSIPKILSSSLSWWAVSRIL